LGTWTSCAKTAELIEMPVWAGDSCRPKVSRIKLERQSSRSREDKCCLIGRWSVPPRVRAVCLPLINYCYEPTLCKILTIFQIVGLSCILNIQDSILSFIFRIVYKTILTTVKLLLEDTFPKISIFQNVYSKCISMILSCILYLQNTF